MTRRIPRALVALALAALLVAPLLGTAVGPAAGHGNHVTARPQISPDGSVVVESLFVLDGGYLVLHEGSQRGDPVGHVRLDQGGHRGVTVQVEEDWWASQDETVPLVAVLHRDAERGDDFDPEVDTPVSAFGSVASSSFTVGKGDAPVNLVATKFSGHGVDDAVTVPRVELDGDGYVVVRAEEDGGPGEIVGHAAVEAGNHSDVEVPVDSDALGSDGETVYLWVSVVRDDGDGSYGEADEPVVVGGDPVQSRIQGTLGGDGGELTVGVNTPTDTTSGDATDGGTTDSEANGPATTDSGGEGTSMPAVGVLGTVAAVLAGVILGVRRQ
jgi:hypothetical protein